jgi:UDP-glucose 4-epimerase
MPLSGVKPMRCLVTGASSQLGACLTRLLAVQGHRVGILVRQETNLWRLRGRLEEVTVLQGTLREPQSAVAAIRKFGPQMVFHLAWEGVDKAARNSPSQITTNLIGSLAWLETVLEAGVQCFVGVGSQSEYGPYPGVLNEDSPLHPIDLYGSSKMCLGSLLVPRCKLAGARGVWLRLFATYGPADDERRLIPYLIYTLLNGVTPQLSAGTQFWDYLHVKDAARALAQAGFSGAQGIFNLASGKAWTVRAIAEFIRNEIDPSLSLNFQIHDESTPLQADISRICDATGWSPRISLGQGLRRTIEWYKALHEAMSGPTVATDMASLEPEEFGAGTLD